MKLIHDRYNTILVNKCKNLGGKWDAQEKCWNFDEIVEKEVIELNDLFNSDLVIVEITALDRCSACTEALTFLGYTIARAFSRDGGAKLGEGVFLLSGKIHSGGSMKNWSSDCAAGSLLKLKVSKKLLESHQEMEAKKNNFSWKIIE